MERGVIETFDLLRPEVDPHFLLTLTARKLNLPVLEELEGRGLSFSFFSDTHGWPRIGKPRSFGEAWKMIKATLLGNRDVLKAAKGKDVIYLPSANYFVFATAASLKHRIPNRQHRIIYHFHDLVLNSSPLLGMVAPFVTDFIHNTETGRRAVTAPNPYVAKKRNWVVPIPVQGRLASRSSEASGIGAASEGLNILYVGQIATHKGIDLLIEAQKLLHKSHPHVAMHIVGEFQEEECSAKRIREGFDPNIGIHYLGIREDVLDLMTNADIYVHPSPPSRCNESFGRGVVEAMSTGTPVVCFSSGALAEIVKHEKTGLVCAEETAAELAATLKRLLDDGELRRRCGQAARAEFETKYSNSTVKARWMELLEIPPTIGAEHEVRNH